MWITVSGIIISLVLSVVPRAGGNKMCSAGAPLNGGRCDFILSKSNSTAGQSCAISNGEACNADAAEIPFECILDRVMLFSGAHIDYFMMEPPACPRCRAIVTEKTLVEWDGGVEVN
jgi:hypothetical protein